MTDQSNGRKAIFAIMLLLIIIAIYKSGYGFGQWVHELLN